MIKLNEKSDYVEVCAFTGYRPYKLPHKGDESHPDCIWIKQRLVRDICLHLDMGIRVFLSGVALGIDQWAAEIVLLAKELRPDDGIQLWCAVPYARQAAAWSAQEQERYQAILSKADRVDLLSERYYDGCLLARNRYMVDLATHLIAVDDGQKGGTKYTVDYAKKKGLFVSIIDPMDDRNDTTWQGYQD